MTEKSFAFSQQYHTACFSISVATDSEMLARLINGYLDTAATLEEQHKPFFSMSFDLYEDSTQVPETLVGTAVLPNAAIDFTEGRITSWLYIDGDTNIDTFRHNLIFTRPLAAYLHFHEWYPFHAAVVDYQDMIVMFIGEGGRGKSTLAGMLVDSGGEILCDDFVFVSWKDQLLRMLPLPTRFKMKQEDAKREFFAKRPVPAFVSQRDVAVQRMLMILPEYGPERNESFEPLSTFEATELLVMENLVQENGQAQRKRAQQAQFECLCTLGQRVPIFTLRFTDQELNRVSQEVDRLVAQVRSEKR